MRPNDTNPFFFRFVDQLPVLVRNGSKLALDHIPNVNLIPKHDLYSGISPFMICPARIALAFPLVIKDAWRLYAVLVQFAGNGTKTHARSPHSKYTANNGCGVLINYKMVFICRITFISKRGICTHELPVLRTGFFDGFDLFARIAAIKFVK